MDSQESLTLSKELIIVGLESTSAEETIRALAEKLFSLGYVKDTFAEAVLKREAIHPTGLPTEMPVGLPHTDIEHCIKPAISVGILKQPVEFRMMGDPTQKVSVRLVFLLSVINPANQVKILRRLIDFCQQTKRLETLIQNETSETALDFLHQNLILENEIASPQSADQTPPQADSSFEVVVTHPVGLHARPAAKFVQAASSFPCNITISNLSNSKHPVNAKSILSVLTLEVSQGHRIRVQAEGEKAEEALKTLRELIENNFGEN